METRCEYSRLTIPARSEYTKVASRYSGEVARLIGFGEEECVLVELGVSQALEELIPYSFEPEERATIDVSCERASEGLKVTIRDQGLPLDPARTRTGQCPAEGEEGPGESVCIEDYFDEVRFRNLGREGKETILIKHLRNKSITDYFQACELEPYEDRPIPLNVVRASTECMVRPMEPSEAIEVSQCVYKVYGYSYGHESLYYPDQLVELNRSGLILSAVAVVNGVIAGHCALMFWDDSGRIAEMGMGVIKPEFRSMGCFKKLTAYLLERARSVGLYGVYGQAVTNHTYSQQTALDFGMRDCALKIGFIPSAVSFKRMPDQLHQRGSLVVHFKYLEAAPTPEVFAPERHHAIIADLYKQLGPLPTFRVPASPPPETDERVPILKTTTVNALNSAFVEVEQYGRDIVLELTAQLRALCLKRIDAIYLSLDLSEPETFHFTEAFEELGFFFAGILPGAMPKGDALILQYLNNVPIDYQQIHVASDTARHLLAYIERQDPNARGDAQVFT